MEKRSDYSSIRLTNKTALSLRRCARQERTLALWAALILSVVMAVAAVLLGIRYLAAAPILTAVIVLMDAVIYVRAQTRYQSLTAQAICTEASAHLLREEKREKDRRSQAMRDFEKVRMDAQMAEKRASEAHHSPEESFQSAVTAYANSPDPAQEASQEAQNSQESKKIMSQMGTHRRRRQATLTILRTQDAK